MTSGFLGVIQILIVVAIFTSTVLSFKQSSKPSSCRKPLFAESYAEMLQRSKLAKQARGGESNPTPQPVQKPTVVAPVKQSTTVKDELPFDDATYDNLKFVIGKLSARMKSDVPLTRDDLQTFQISCDAIISDAKAPFKVDNVVKNNNIAPPVKKETVQAVKKESVQEVKKKVKEVENTEARRSGNVKDAVWKTPKKTDQQKEEEYAVIWEAGDGPRSEDAPDPDSPYSDLHGLKNTWQMPGMDQMSTEEYYAAINKRILDMKNKRIASEGSSQTMVDDYFDKLSRSNTNKAA